MKKDNYIKEIIESRGEDYYNKNKSLLDAEFEYIKSLGDEDDIEENSSSTNILISTNTKTK